MGKKQIVILRVACIAMVAAVAYVASYVQFRNSNMETWDRDGKDYVIFPQGAMGIYYLFRPATYLDGAVTDMQFHIGPHQED